MSSTAGSGNHIGSTDCPQCRLYLVFPEHWESSCSKIHSLMSLRPWHLQIPMRYAQRSRHWRPEDRACMPRAMQLRCMRVPWSARNQQQRGTSLPWYRSIVPSEIGVCCDAQQAATRGKLQLIKTKDCQRAHCYLIWLCKPADWEQMTYRYRSQREHPR